MNMINAGLLTCLMLPMILSAAATMPPEGLDQKAGLIFRFTGSEASRLKEFLKTRTLEAQDSSVQYYGDKMSLACSEQNVCFLYLSKKEWIATREPGKKALSLDFALPLHQTVLQGQLLISPSQSASVNTFDLQLKDDSRNDSFAFTKALACKVYTKWTEDYLKGNGDCRLEPSSEKKYLTYQPSIQFVQNSESAVSILRGPWAKKLFKAGGHVEVDPEEPDMGRVTLGSQFYCWDLDLQGQELPEGERYICQTRHLPVGKSDIQFIAEGATEQDGKFALVLQPRYEKGLLHGFSLSQRAGQTETRIDYCPYNRNESEPSWCSFVLNYNRDVIYYPVWKPIQGVAVGWGVVPQTTSPRD